MVLFTLKVCCYPVTASWVISRSYNYLITQTVAPLQAGGPQIQHTLQARVAGPIPHSRKDKLPYPIVLNRTK